ncbi:hypothetical protein [Alteromonas sp. BMJM2]|uniref:hypothetical protein n=1 Tax=Alteromonas sp. BMJM2 TaxID=2954241 RepID=UPI0022B4F430|nr:hypothetical protein [Alteromonas sp. BMJM2]
MVIIGGMVTFQALFAPLIFIKLPIEVARPFIRTFFPFYYLYFGALSLLATASAIMSNHCQVAWLIAPVTLGFIISRQILMPLANHATDNQREKKFQLYHRLTVLINTVQLVALCMAFYGLLAPY